LPAIQNQNPNDIKTIFMRLLFFIIGLIFNFTAKSQNLHEYLKKLTSDSKQSWKLDSVSTQYGHYGKFKKGTILTFKLDNKTFLINDISLQNQTFTWSLESRESRLKYILLNIQGFERYEVDFVQIKGVLYMRLQDEIHSQKNIEVTQYYFVKSTM